MLGAIKSKLGYETLPAGLENKSFYDLKAQLPGQDKYLDFVSYALCDGQADSAQSTFKGKVVLIVNTASKWYVMATLWREADDPQWLHPSGTTTCRHGADQQYTGLEKLYKDYHDRGLEVIGFPSNEFNGQEPGDDEQIAQFCQVRPHMNPNMFCTDCARSTTA